MSLKSRFLDKNTCFYSRCYSKLFHYLIFLIFEMLQKPKTSNEASNTDIFYQTASQRPSQKTYSISMPRASMVERWKIIFGYFGHFGNYVDEEMFSQKKVVTYRSRFFGRVGHETSAAIRAQPDWAYEFPDWTGLDRTGHPNLQDRSCRTRLNLDLYFTYQVYKYRLSILIR